MNRFTMNLHFLNKWRITHCGTINNRSELVNKFLPIYSNLVIIVIKKFSVSVRTVLRVLLSLPFRHSQQKYYCHCHLRVATIDVWPQTKTLVFRAIVFLDHFEFEGWRVAAIFLENSGDFVSYFFLT